MDTADFAVPAPDGAALPSASIPQHPTVDLRILTQSPDISNQLHFHSIRTSTTVAELKLHIANASSPQIPVDSQRLIYKGRLLAADGDTLANIFGQDAVGNDNIAMMFTRDYAKAKSQVNASAPLVIHLVHTDPRVARPATQTTASTNPQTVHNQPEHLPQAVPAPFPHMPAPFPAPFNAFPQPMMHPFNAAMLGPMRNMVQPPNAGIAGMQVPQGGTQVEPGSEPPRPSSVPLPGHNGSVPGSITTTQGVAPNGQRFTMTVNTQTMAVPFQGVPPGHQFMPLPQMMMQPQMVMPPHMAMQPLPWMPGANLPPGLRIPPTIQQGLPGAFIPGHGQSNGSAEFVRANQLRQSMIQMSNRLRFLRTQVEETLRRDTGREAADMTSGNLPQHDQHQPLFRSFSELEGEIALLNHQMGHQAAEEAALRQLLSMYARQPPFQGQAPVSLQNTTATIPSGGITAIPPTSQPNQLAPSQTQSGNALQGHPLNDQAGSQPALPGRSSAGAATGPGTASQADRPSASADLSAPTVFLLSSPTGPSALLLSPQGTYASPAFPTPVRTYPSSSTADNATHQHQAQQPNTSNRPDRTPPQPAPQPPQQEPRRGVVRPENPQHQQQPPQPQQPQGDGALRFMLSLWGPVWLLIRIGGFLWLFGAGSWWKYVIITFLVVVIAGTQGGLFGNRGERVRQHFQRLLPLAPEPGAVAAAGAAPPEAGRQRGDGQNDQQREGGQDQARRRPTPEEAAQRLIREREARDRSWIREYLEPVERAVALFVASLWPGLGERHIRAREAAEREARGVAEERRVEGERRADDERRAEEEWAARPGRRVRFEAEDVIIGEEDGQVKGEDKGKAQAKADDGAVGSSTAVDPVSRPAAESGTKAGEGSSGVRHREPQESGQPVVDV